MDTHQVPPEWLTEAGLRDFKPASPAFRCDGPHVLIPLAEIECPRRNPGVTLDRNGFGRERMMNILIGIQRGDAMPPIQIEAADSGPRRFRLRAGFHRYYASLAVGYSYVPAEIVDRLW